MAIMINKQGIETDKSHSHQELLAMIDNYHNSPARPKSNPIVPEWVSPAVVEAIKASANYTGLHYEFAKKSVDDVNPVLLVTGFDISKKTNLSEDDVVHMLDCPSSACP